MRLFFDGPPEQRIRLQQHPQASLLRIVLSKTRSAYSDSNGRLFDTEVASIIYHLRTKARLSQRALAKKIGTTASVICLPANADYEGHSLAMLRRIRARSGQAR